jgi:deaminated glutathione amidase
MSREITIASCQHTINSSISNNLKIIQKQIKYAKSNGADIVHFSECNLSAYGGIEFTNYDKKQEQVLQDALKKIQQLAKELKIWIILGSHHFCKGLQKPYNCLYLINEDGKIQDRYDKRFLYGMNEEKEGKYYTPGSETVTFQFKNIKCGLLICHEWRYTEFYREHKKLGTELIFQSFYDRYLNKEEFKNEGIYQSELVIGTMRGNAANNHLWISASNTSKNESCFPSMILQPDGRIKSKLARNRTGVLITKIDLDQKFPDPSGYWRKRILK